MTCDTLALPRPAPCGLELVAVALAGLNLRGALAAPPALAGPIRGDAGLTATEIGLLTTLPLLCLGLAAPLTARITARFGTDRTIAAALATLAGGLAARHWSGAPTALYASTLVAGLGIGIVGAALPGFVRERFATRVGAVTGLYTGALTLGASLAAGFAVPAETLLGSWQDSLALWTIPALAGALAWLTLDRKRRQQRERPAPSPLAPSVPSRLPWRDRTAWIITAYLSTQSALAFSELAWIGPAYTDLHQSPQTAGLLVAGFAAAGVIATLAAPALADRFPRRALITGALTCALSATGLLAFAPEITPWGTVILLGVGQSAGFALGLVLLAASAPTPAATRGLTAMTFVIAYPAAAAAPPLLGALRDTTGTFTIPFLTLAALNVVALILAAGLPPTPRTRRQHRPVPRLRSVHSRQRSTSDNVAVESCWTTLRLESERGWS